MNKLTNNGEQYVVTRNGIRVSEIIHTSKEDAEKESLHWKSIIKRFPDGSKVNIELYDENKHRIY